MKNKDYSMLSNSILKIAYGKYQEMSRNAYIEKDYTKYELANNELKKIKKYLNKDKLF